MRRAGEDLRHRRRRGGARPSPARPPTPPRRVGGCPRPLRRSTSSGSGPTSSSARTCAGTVIFGRHDLVQDAPISHIDLLACRNTLMYFNAETQARVLDRFHFALEDGGVLFLGKAEMLLRPRRLFAPLDLKRARLRQGVRWTAAASGSPSRPTAARYEPLEYPLSYRRARELALDAVPIGHGGGRTAAGAVAMANAAARRLFGLSARDVGRPFQDLELSYRPVELRSRMEQVLEEQPAAASSSRSPGPAAPTATRLLRHPRRPARRTRQARTSGWPCITFIDVHCRRAGSRTSCERHQPGAGDRLRGAAVDQRGAGDHQRGAPVDDRGAGDDQRGAPVDQRGARDDERRAPVDQRGAPDDQRRAADAHRANSTQANDFLESMLLSQRGRPGGGRPRPPHLGLERPVGRAVGAADRRGARAALPQPRHRPTGRGAAPADQGHPGRGVPAGDGGARRHEPAWPGLPLPGHDDTAGRSGASRPAVSS